MGLHEFTCFYQRAPTYKEQSGTLTFLVFISQHIVCHGYGDLTWANNGVRQQGFCVECQYFLILVILVLYEPEVLFQAFWGEIPSVRVKKKMLDSVYIH